MSSLSLFKTGPSALMTILISILILMKDIIDLIIQDYVFLIVTTTITLSSYTSNLLLYTIQISL